MSSINITNLLPENRKLNPRSCLIVILRYDKLKNISWNIYPKTFLTKTLTKVLYVLLKNQAGRGKEICL